MEVYKSWPLRTNCSVPLVVIRELNFEFKKLRRQLQRHIKIELCVSLSVLRLFQVVHDVQKWRIAVSLAWHGMVFMQRQRMKDLPLRAWVVVRTSKMKISRRRLADYVKALHQKACHTCSTIIFLHSTNQIIDLWRCRWCCRRQSLNFLISRYRVADYVKNCTKKRAARAARLNVLVFSALSWSLPSSFLKLPN